MHNKLLSPQAHCKLLCSSANQCILGNVYLRSNLSRKVLNCGTPRANASTRAAHVMHIQVGCCPSKPKTCFENNVCKHLLQPYDPGISLGFANQCILGDIYLISNLSRKHLLRRVLKHLPNVETHFYCHQAILSLGFQCRDDVSEIK